MKKLFAIVLLFVLVAGLYSFIQQKKMPADKAALGRLLFFDPLLSKTKKISCATCHKEQFAFSDSSPVSLGVFGRKGVRNTPSAMNVRLQANFFWDGRAATLEDQALMPIENHIEMDLPIAILIDRLNKDPFYNSAFKHLFQEAPNKMNLAKALAAFERTLETGETPFDDWRLNDNEAAVNASAKRGFTLFNGKGKCFQCHFGADFNSAEFRNIGLYDGKTFKDSGRGAITKNTTDIGKFKIGPLRNIALTAPYMHNGMFKTLPEVINFYNDPTKVIPGNIGRDSILAKPLGLDKQEQADLVAFLQSLTDKRFLKK